MKASKNRRFKQIALAVSLCMFILWGVLGTGASLAWFRDKDTELKNVFHFAEFDLQVFHLTEDNKWEEVQQDTKLFDDEALYEPGYVQVIYLKVRNNGDVPFEWNTAVRPYSSTKGINVFGDSFDLKEYLEFGVVENDDFNALKESITPREKAVAYATEPLDLYSTTKATLYENSEKYLAIIVRMPEEVANVANYKHPHQPEIKLSVIVSATQINPKPADN